ncbi:MAG: sulfite exporter TauE/SafE family protein, partial [Synergistales bacterium]|nr:sulfite exporter TauE/SafE family protein [Synergistales bacterium]
MQVLLISLATFIVAVFMTMAGRGGGNFYVILQVLAGASMGLAASTGQFLMFSTSFAAMFIFHKHKTVSWPMAAFIGLTTSLMAFVGGVSASSFSGTSLKLIFSLML